MRCPKCQFDHELQTTECLKCGIVFARYEAALAAQKEAQAALETGEKPATLASTATHAAAEPESGEVPSPGDAAGEFKIRVLALPAALIVARLVVGTGMRLAVNMLTMVLHESGHAITSWLTGRWAVPLLWVTMHGEQRSWLFVLALVAAIGFWGYWAWKGKHWTWVGAAGAVFFLQLIILTRPAFTEGALIVFGGDGGAFVLATILMAMFYMPRQSALGKSWGLRWGLLAIGAAAFADAFSLWWGARHDVDRIPFGMNEGAGLSDPSVLSDQFGWSSDVLVRRYVILGCACLIALAAAYAAGLLRARAERE